MTTQNNNDVCPVQIYLPRSLKERLQAEADKQMRTLSNLACVIINDWITTRKRNNEAKGTADR